MKCTECGGKYQKNTEELMFNNIVEAFVCEFCDDQIYEQEAFDEMIEQDC